MDSRILDINSQYLGVSVETLMENAGIEVARQASSYLNIALFCGRGNNGGDGLVAAKILTDSGKKTTVYLLEGELSRLTQLNLERLPGAVKLIRVNNNTKLDDLDSYDLIIDALLGTGFEGELREPFKLIIHKINESNTPKLSVDCPSAGIVEADMVLSLHSSKVMGAKVADIGIPSDAQKYCGPGDVVYAIPKRDNTSHKGEYGKILVIGGSKNYIGTPTLVGQAALRVGADLVTLAVPQYVADKIPYDPNLMLIPLADKEYVSPKGLDELDTSMFDTVVVGNGLGKNSESKKAIKKIMGWNLNTIIDADALNLLELDWIHEKSILTPHQKEFQRLFGGELENIKEEFVEKMALENNCTIVLKSETDVISNGDESRLNKTGNPFMTVGGTGDVLAGVITGLVSQNKKLFESACAGTFLTGLAGDICAKKLSESLIATDVIESLPFAISECRSYQK